jgi:uncharacterized protein YkwD
MKKQTQKFNKLSKVIASTILASSVVFSANTALALEISTENLSYLINQQRAFYNLRPLTIDTDLTKAATLKSKDMINRDYFEHYAYGLSPWDFMKNSGYNYLYAGENLAMGFETSEGVVRAWINSPAHRANLLNPDYDEMGLGVVKGAYTDNTGKTEDTVMITNMFGRKKPVVVDIFNQIVSGFKNIFRIR